MCEQDLDAVNALSAFIICTHENLRAKFESSNDCDDVWNSHLFEGDTRKKYAESMKKLGQDVWASGSAEDCRVGWCYQYQKHYFANLLQSCIQKDIRMSLREIEAGALNTKADCEFSSENPDEETRTELSKYSLLPPDSTYTEVEISSLAELLYGSSAVSRYCSEIQLLDVGSCYNPFKQFKDEKLKITAIDLTPGSADVLQADFVNISISHKLSFDVDNSVSCLPGEFYEVVTFCLLLSYIPCPQQRLAFCKKARSLLKFNGLLIITETQSITPHSNTMLMKQWQVEIESLGFRRVVYESKQHIHAMAFRKVPYWLRPVLSPKYIVRGYLPINQDLKNRRSGKRTSSDKIVIPRPPHKQLKIEDNSKEAVVCVEVDVAASSLK